MLPSKILDSKTPMAPRAYAPRTPDGPLANEIAPLASLLIGVAMMIVIAAPSAL